MTNGFDPDQERCSVGLIWVQTVCKDYQQQTKVTASKERVKLLQTELTQIRLLLKKQSNQALYCLISKKYLVTLPDNPMYLFFAKSENTDKMPLYELFAKTSVMEINIR